MLVKVQNLGTLQTAETDLSKDLIVFCGGNNSGKTYMLNFLYGILKIGDFFNSSKSLELEIKELLEKKYIQFNLKELDQHVFLNFKTYKLGVLADFIGLEKLPGTFNFDIENYNFNLEAAELNSNTEILNSTLKKYGIQFEAEFINGKDIGIKLILMPEGFNTIRLLEVFPATILQIILHNLTSSFEYQYRLPRFFTAERQSSLLFSHEIFKARFDMTFDANAKKPLYKKYPTSLLDELRFVNEFIENRDKKSEFEHLAKELETLIGGKIGANQDGGLEYQQSKSKTKLSMVAVSSTIKSLANIVFYFRHLAKKGECIIIDEPELSLHPDNQRKFARFLAQVVNEGFKVIISTHSDYIISEINNLITLHNHKDTARTKSIMKKYGYKANQTLDYQRVGAYLFRDNKNELIPMTQQGFSVATIDAEIDNLADASDDIANNFDSNEM